jgi:antitoxin CptB
MRAGSGIPYRLGVVSGGVAKLRWRCRRGMRELDAVLQSFVENELASLSDTDVACFERILDLPDPMLLAYLSGRNVPHDADIAHLIERIRASHRPSA